MAKTFIGGKVKTTLNGAQRLIVAEVIKALKTKPEKAEGKNLEALAFYMEGTMGIGKSQSVKNAVKTLTQLTGKEFGLIDIRLAGMTGSDIQGIPVPVKHGERMILEWLKDKLLPGISDDCPKHGILFLDELNQVEDNSVKSLLYQLILDKKINDYVVPDGWFIVAAGNREEDGGVYNRLPAPVRDRMMIVDIEASQDEWIDWARRSEVHPSVISFMETAKEDVFHTYNAELEAEGDEECKNYVFATPRSWTMVSDEIRCFEDPNINVDIQSYGKLVTMQDLYVQFGGLLGSELGNEFFAFYQQIGNLDLDSITRLEWQDGKPTTQEPTINESQLVYLTNLAAFPTEEKFANSVKILMYLISRGASTTNVSIVLNSYTEAQNDAFLNYCINTRSTALITQAQDINSKFKQISEQFNQQ